MSVGGRIRRRLLPLHQSTVRRVHDLSYLFIELTHRCNLSCLHCGSDCTRDTNTADLRIEDVVGVLEDIRGAYDQHDIAVVLSGGEPLCHPKVFELGSKLTELEFPWGMVTNGYAWNDRAFELARRAHMASVTVSLDGLADDHDWLRGRTGSYERALRTISRLASEKYLKAMDVITCVNQRNLTRLDDVRDLLISLNVKAWRLFTISPIGRAKQRPELMLEPKQYHHLMRKILSWREQSGIDVALSESGYLGLCLERRVRPQDHFCRAGINIAGILVDGSILACPNIDRRFRQGSIHEDSFVDVWENRYQAFRKRDWMRTGRCADCREWSLCRGGAFHLREKGQEDTRMCHYVDLELRDFTR